MTEKNIHDGHRKRLRDRAMNEGLEAFNPHQVLELLLFYAIPRQDTSDMAHLLIERFGSVHATLNAPTTELTKIPGVGRKTAEWLTSLGKLVENYGSLRGEDRLKIVNLKSVRAFCRKASERCDRRAAYLMCMAPSGTLQLFDKISDSPQWGDSQVLRAALREAMSVQARNVIVVEFTQDARPQVEEYHRQSAEKYAQVLKIMGAELLDVLLVGDEGIFSMNESGDFDRSKHGAARSILAENYLREDADLDDRQPSEDGGMGF